MIRTIKSIIGTLLATWAVLTLFAAFLILLIHIFG
jgi:hypothetical protein